MNPVFRNILKSLSCFHLVSHRSSRRIWCVPCCRTLFMCSVPSVEPPLTWARTWCLFLIVLDYQLSNHNWMYKSSIPSGNKNVSVFAIFYLLWTASLCRHEDKMYFFNAHSCSYRVCIAVPSRLTLPGVFSFFSLYPLIIMEAYFHHRRKTSCFGQS